MNIISLITIDFFVNISYITMASSVLPQSRSFMFRNDSKQLYLRIYNRSFFFETFCCVAFAFYFAFSTFCKYCVHNKLVVLLCVCFQTAWWQVIGEMQKYVNVLWILMHTLCFEQNLMFVIDISYRIQLSTLICVLPFALQILKTVGVGRHSHTKVKHSIKKLRIGFCHLKLWEHQSPQNLPFITAICERF